MGRILVAGGAGADQGRSRRDGARGTLRRQTDSARPALRTFPSRLADPAPVRYEIRFSPLLAVGLVLLCLLPRAAMAWRIGSLCPDGVLYVELAKALEAGDLGAGLREMNLNTFTLALALLHRAGLDWELAAKLWGVGLASLTVLPLYGWVRRQFDGRTALAACFLYAMHAPLTRWSPEALRDPTFWFLFTLSIYLLWRAVTEVRLWFCAAAGAATVLAVLTRFEGVFLFIPLGLWTFWRYLALRQARGRLLVGTIACLSVFPLLAILVNLTLLHGHPQWAFSRLRPISLAHAWLQSYRGSAALAAMFPELPTLAAANRMPRTLMLLVFGPTLVKGFAPIFGLLMLGGVWRWRKVWARRDVQPLFYLGLAVLAGMWIQFWVTQETSSRYVFPIVIGATPFAALGLLDWSAAIRRLARRGRLRRWSPAIALCPFCIMTVTGLAAALVVGDYQHRAGQAALGRWIGRQFGPSPTLVGVYGPTDVVNYYAEGDCSRFFAADSEETVVGIVRRHDPDVVLLVPTSRMNPARCRGICRQLAGLGFDLIEPARLPAGCESLLVLARGRTARPLSNAHARRNPTSNT